MRNDFSFWSFSFLVLFQFQLLVLLTFILRDVFPESKSAQCHCPVGLSLSTLGHGHAGLGRKWLRAKYYLQCCLNVKKSCTISTWASNVYNSHVVIEIWERGEFYCRRFSGTWSALRFISLRLRESPSQNNQRENLCKKFSIQIKELTHPQNCHLVPYLMQLIIRGSINSRDSRLSSNVEQWIRVTTEVRLPELKSTPCYLLAG